MNFIFIAKHKKSYQVPDERDKVFISDNEVILEYLKVSRIKYEKSQKYRIYKYINLEFHLYKKKLLIMKKGTTRPILNKYKSDYNIIESDGLFLVRGNDNNHSLIVNHLGDSFTIKYRDDIIYFTSIGVIFYVDNLQVIKKRCDCVACWHKLPSRSQLYQGYLSYEYKGENVKYNKNGEMIKIGSDIILYKESAIIKDILDIGTLQVNGYEVIAVLTTSDIFLIYGNSIISKSHKGYRHIIPSIMVMHNFTTFESFSNLLCYFNVFNHMNLIGFNVNTTFYTEIANFYCEMKKLKTDILENAWNVFICNIKDDIRSLCKAYRLLDDEGKKDLIKFISFEKIDAESLSLIIQYQQDKIEILVDKAINENKIYLLKDLYDYQMKIETISPLRKILLERNILFEKVVGYEELYEMQMIEVESSRRVNVDIITDFSPFSFKPVFK